jgi:hypothetical protein
MSKKSLLIRAAVLSAVVVVAAGITLPLGWLFTRDRAGVVAGLTAAAVCWFAALLALGIGQWLRAAGHLLAFLTATTTIRMGIPLLAVAATIFFRCPLDATDFLYYLIVFYPITLAAEIVLILPGRAGGSGSAN